MVKKRSRKEFNWQGISENADGTFTAKGKREKTRVLKALHEQGVGVRSKHNSDGTWTITPSGTIRAPRERVSVAPAFRETGRRISTRISGFSRYPRGRGYPSAGRASGRAFPHVGVGPVYGPRPRASGPSVISVIGKKAGEYLRGRAQKQEQQRKDEAERKKNAEEINTKMREERIAQEIHKQKEEAQKQLEKDRLRREAMGQQSGDLERSLHQADVKTEQRRIDDTVKRQQEQRQQRQDIRRQGQPTRSSGSIRAPEIPPQKVDEATLQHARENAVKGED